MELTNEFTVDVPPEQAWDVLTDVERIAPCMPGAQLREIEGEEYRGVVRVKVGPITAEYKGVARFLEQDPVSRKAVLRAEGRETRGQGNASATITATLEPADVGTRVSVVTDLTVSGRVAQFGRGVLADVSNKLLGQFVDCLESTVLAAAQPGQPGQPPAGEAGAAESAGGPEAVPGGPAERAASTAPKGAGPKGAGPAPQPEAVDLLQVAGASVLKRVAPLLAGVTVLLIVASLLRRRKGR